MGAHKNYFETDESELAAGIEERSIKVIYDFIDWPNEMPDPIDEVPYYSKEELQRMKAGMRGIADYVNSWRQV
ncbi:hypothetical protein AZ34_03670 [Hylemonella gracilis str. Niagara R]|uniref:Uncharacterized protein n=1 Tax=Hylemonella gracilis str. Niagara R TaxID=1458275 RepID=A0A016XNI1_9BURK|nr:hypothetical protein AZ34_03670 [Hylemonella gracilis str. Niagara R]